MDFLKRVFIFSEKNVRGDKELAPEFFSSFCAIAAVIVFAVALIYNAISYVLDLKKLISDLQDPKEVNKLYLITVYLGLFSQYYPFTDSYGDGLKDSGKNTMRAICYIHVIFSLIVLLVYLWFFSLKHINLTIAIPAYSFKSIAFGMQFMIGDTEDKYKPGWEDTASLFSGIGNFALLLYIAFVVGNAVKGDAEALTPVLTFSSLTMVTYTMLGDLGFLGASPLSDYQFNSQALYLGAIFWLCILGDFKKYAILQVVMRSYYQWMYIAGATGINMLHVYHYVERTSERKMYKVICQILLYVGWVMGLFILVCMILHILFAKKQSLAQKFTAAASTSV